MVLRWILENTNIPCTTRLLLSEIISESMLIGNFVGLLLSKIFSESMLITQCVCVFVMLASHCPEVEQRWTHDAGNVHLRRWSCKHRAIRVGIFSHRMTAGGIYQASAVTSCVMTKSLACPKTAEGLYEGSCIRVSILPFARSSWSHLVRSCRLRSYFVWSNAQSSHEDNTRETRTFPIVLGSQHDFVKPSQYHRIPVLYHRIPSYFYYDGIEMVIRRRWRHPNDSPQTVDVTILRVGIFLSPDQFGR